MTPGTVLLHQNFLFSDGNKAKKLLVLLAKAVDSYSCVLVKTTSKERHKGKKSGCQKDDIYPNFFIPHEIQENSFFKKDTWIDLNEFFEFKYTKLIQEHFSGEIRTIGSLALPLTRNLLNCAIQCGDITTYQEEAVKSTLANLDSCSN